MKTAKLDEQMKRSIIDKRCAETALIEAKTKLVIFEIEKTQKSDKTPTVNYEQLNTVLIEANKELMEENGELNNQLDTMKACELSIKEIVEKQFKLSIENDKLKSKLRWNRFWFISIAGILSGILLFMILNFVH